MGLICHDCGFYPSVSEKPIVSRHEVMTTITTINIHQMWGQLQRHKSQLVTAPPEAVGTQGAKIRREENVLVTKRNIARWRKLRASSL